MKKIFFACKKNYNNYKFLQPLELWFQVAKFLERPYKSELASGGYEKNLIHPNVFSINSIIQMCFRTKIRTFLNIIMKNAHEKFQFQIECHSKSQFYRETAQVLFSLRNSNYSNFSLYYFGLTISKSFFVRLE